MKINEETLLECLNFYNTIKHINFISLSNIHLITDIIYCGVVFRNSENDSSGTNIRSIKLSSYQEYLIMKRRDKINKILKRGHK